MVSEQKHEVHEEAIENNEKKEKSRKQRLIEDYWSDHLVGLVKNKPNYLPN